MSARVSPGMCPVVMPSVARDLLFPLLAVLSIPARSGGQAAAPVTPPTSHDSSAHQLNVDASRIQPARFSYRLQIVRDTVTTLIGDQESSITAQDYAGTPAFLLARSGMQGVAATADSLVVRRDNLRPLHWIASHGAARAAVEFTPDSVFGAMTSPLGKQNVVLPNRADLLANAMAMDVVIGALPLGAAWRDSATMIVIDAGGSAITPVSLSVEGEEKITVPAGEFDCWIVSIESERASARLWLTKQGQIVVRSEQILPDVGGATLTRMLVQTDSPALQPASARLPP